MQENKNIMKDSGLTDRQLELIRKATGQFTEIEAALLFGSRAMGNYKPGSDVDIAIKGRCITEETIRSLNTLLNEELPLPHFFDIIHYDTLDNESLVQHINQHGVPL